MGLALQYLLERGFPFPDVKLEHLYCTQYENRAVMLGCDVRNFAEVPDFESSQQVKTNHRYLVTQSKIDALVGAIVKLFENIVDDSVDNMLDSEGDLKNAEDSHSVLSMPAKSSGLNDREYNLLKQLSGGTNVEFMRVIDTLGDLGAIDGRCDWLEYIPILECQISRSTQIPVKMLNATLMGETIEQILTRCSALSTSEKSFIRLIKRFKDICNHCSSN